MNTTEKTTVLIHIVGRIQSLFKQPGKQQLFVTIGKNSEGFKPTLFLEPQAFKNQTWCLVGCKAIAPSDSYYMCSYPDLRHYVRISAHDINPLDSEAFCHVEVDELAVPFSAEGSLQNLGPSAMFSLHRARVVPGATKSACYHIRSVAKSAAVLQAGMREPEPWPNMRVCAHGVKDDSRELWFFENDPFVGINEMTS